MPELPEVETIRRVLEKNIAGRRIIKIDIRPGKTTASRLNQDLRAAGKNLVHQVAGRKIVAVRRRAKYLVLELDQGLLVFHLGMTGQLFAGCQSKAPVCQIADLPDKHTHLILDLSGGWTIYFRDIRKFGRVRFLLPAEATGFFRKLGPEPLSVKFTWETLRQGLEHKKASIKALLLNQTIVSGLGNIYVDEALFRAGIAPQRTGESIREKENIKLRNAIQEVLKEAIRFRGTSMSDYYDPESRKGGFQERLKVYGQEGRPCPVCGTKIRKAVIAQRGTHWCPKCQRYGQTCVSAHNINIMRANT